MLFTKTPIAWLLLTLPAISTLALAPSASSAPPGPAPRPLVTPWTFAPEVDGVEALGLHAAGLGFLDGWQIGVAAAFRLSGDEASAGAGGLLAARLGPLALGVGLSGIGDGPGTQTNTTRLDYGFALRLSDTFALGAHHVNLGSASDPLVDDYSAWSLSTTWRPSRGFALALALEELDSPVLLDGTEADPTARLSLGFRPGTDRLTFGLEVARDLTDDDARWQAMATARVMAVPGLWLGAWVRHRFGEEGGPHDTEGGVSLGLSQGGLAMSAGVDVRSGQETPARLTTLVTASGGGAATPSILPGPRRAVRLQLSGDLPERPGETLWGRPLPGFAHWLMALELIARDEAVAGLVLQIDQAPNWAQCWELREAMARIEARGKKVLAILTVGDMRAAYLASAADEVHLYAAGGLLLNGLAITQTYWFGLMEKLGVKAELVRWDEYKTAPEPFTRAGPSDPSIEQTRALLDGVSETWLAALSSGRKLTREEVVEVLANGPQTMKEAVAERLVDGLVEADGVGALVERAFGPGVVLTRGYEPPPEGFARWGTRKKVAVVPVVGSIVDGRSAGDNPLPLPFIGGESTGDATFVAALDAAISDRDVVGVVVRVDSGGGSAIASDKMHRALQEAQKKKPLVVSFGNVAASGGYYLAAGSEILATPVTITGSIGIFAGKVDLAGLFGMLGITTHTEKTSPRADMMSPYRGFSDEEREVARQTLRAYYDRFLELVAAGRKMSKDDVDKIARGRVWLGGAAHERKLVDRLAGLMDAIEAVKARAGYGPDEALGVTYFGSLGALSGLQRFIGGVFFDGHDAAEVLSAPPHPPADPTRGALSMALTVMQGAGPLALMPTSFEIR